MDQMRAQLDELMGKERDLPQNLRSNQKLSYDDPSVCKYDLLGICPYQLFKNTKSDLGACHYQVHKGHLDWEKIVEQWTQLSKGEQRRYRYKEDLMKLLQDLVLDMDRKIEKQKERAAKECQPRELRPHEQEELDKLLEKQKELTDKSQEAQEEGDIDASLQFATEAEQQKIKHDRLQKSYTLPDRHMDVCEVCGVFINSTDNEQRRKDHLNGKQYNGWKNIRDTLERLQQESKDESGLKLDDDIENSGADDENKRRGEHSPSESPKRRRYSRDRSRDRSRSPDYYRESRQVTCGYGRISVKIVYYKWYRQVMQQCALLIALYLVIQADVVYLAALVVVRLQNTLMKGPPGIVVDMIGTIGITIGTTIGIHPDTIDVKLHLPVTIKEGADEMIITVGGIETIESEQVFGCSVLL